jgi:hypothetical protein
MRGEMPCDQAGVLAIEGDQLRASRSTTRRRSIALAKNPITTIRHPPNPGETLPATAAERNADEGARLTRSYLSTIMPSGGPWTATQRCPARAEQRGSGRRAHQLSAYPDCCGVGSYD